MQGGQNRKTERNAQMVRDYQSHGMVALAEKYQITLSTVHRILTREKVTKRPRGNQPRTTP